MSLIHIFVFQFLVTQVDFSAQWEAKYDYDFDYVIVMMNDQLR